MIIKFNIIKLKSHQLWQLNQFLDLSILDPSCVLAGGALKSLYDYQPINDYDLFILSENIDDLNKKKKDLETKLVRRGFKQIFNCPLGELSTFKLGPMKIQIINVGNKIYHSKEDVINEFDFNLCRMVIDSNEDLTIDVEAIRNIKKKELSIYKVTNPSSTINRFVKYRNAGFNIVPAIKEFSSHFANNIQFNIPMNMDIIYVD